MPSPAETASPQPQIHRGLAGVVVDETAISMVNPKSNSLTYRGYPVQQLAARCTFLQVAYLLWHGELPTETQLADLTETERRLRPLSPDLQRVLADLPATSHPMDALRTATSLIGAADPTEQDAAPQADLAKAIDLLAKLPSVVALDLRARRRLAPIQPDPELDYVSNFFQMCFGTVPDERTRRAFDISLILYAEHSFNASTFTARVVTSTMSDLHSAVTAAIGALKGPLHGGANEAVLRMLDEIGEAGNVPGWLDTALAQKRKIMGFGHRVYKHGDSRVPTLQAELDAMTADGAAGGQRATYDALAAGMLDRKNIHPNLDYPSALVYHLMGFPTEVFTPIFVMSRITGWTAHILEQAGANALIRPLSAYTGPAERDVPQS